MHHIRNNLQAIVIASELLSNQDLGVEAETTLDIIAQSAKEAQGLIQSVESTKGLLNSPLVTLNLIRAIENVLQYYRYDKDVDITLEIPNQSMKILADQHLTYLIRNIIDNGIRYNQHDRKRVWISIKKANNGYEIVIGDNGVGISSMKKNVMFDPNRRFGGVGIHQAMRITEKYGGKITVRDRIEGKPSEGTEFVIWLPMV